MSFSRQFGTREIAVIAVMGALTTIATSQFVIPFPPTRGYFNLGDVVVVTTGLLFGPVVGGLAGGIGSGLADLLGGWMQYIIPTIITKGFEGFAVGYIAGKPENRTLSRNMLAWIIGAIILISGYFITEAFFLGYGLPAAAAEAVTINVPQAIVSALGIPISIAIRKRLGNFLSVFFS